MSRIKRGVMHVKRRRNILKAVKGYKQGRRKLIKQAKFAIDKAGQNAYRDRKKKKRTKRALWNIQLNATVRPTGLTYSKFIFALKKNKIALDRKILAGLANNEPAIFAKLIEKIK